VIKGIVFGLVGGLAIGGFWNLQDVYPAVANAVLIALSAVFLVWTLRIR
jgi:hypothetical protein